ncbi:response regulator transcription factor [Crateriforma spongiae]|uniref:response regulator transcription factor n=1 Tax=Crateriforma spongiae TaxID=2724528 RepID=UPI0039AF9A7F
MALVGLGGKVGTNTLFLVAAVRDQADAVAASCESAQWALQFCTGPSEYACVRDASHPSCAVIFESQGIPPSFLSLRDIADEVPIPWLVLTDRPDMAVATKWMRCGAMDVFPIDVGTLTLRAAIENAMRVDAEKADLNRRMADAKAAYATLSPRQREIVHLVLEGRQNKWIANSLEISKRTVELDRATVLAKLNVENAVELARLVTELRCHEQWGGCVHCRIDPGTSKVAGPHWQHTSDNQPQAVAESPYRSSSDPTA